MRMILFTLSVILIASCASAEGEPRGPVTGGPLVLELFTSQGCSSCPPADALLSRLVRSGEHVAPLSFHVDYWNDLGWADPFSLPAWTERQQSYARALGDNRVYTPELVIGGATGVVGSQEAAVSRAIAGATRPAILPASATWGHDKVEIKATVERSELFCVPRRGSPLSKMPREHWGRQDFQAVTLDMGGVPKAPRQIKMPRARSGRRVLR